MKITATKILGAAVAVWAIQEFFGGNRNSCGYKVTQADHDAVEAALFVHPLDWLLPPVGSCVDSKYLGKPTDKIPGQDVFTWNDAKSDLDGQVPFMWRPIVAKQAQNLAKLQQATGRRVKLTSWWRGPKESRALDQGEFDKRGGWGGYHPCGAAVDMKLEGFNNDQTHRTILSLISQGVISDGGVGVYQSITSIHYDNRAEITGQHGGKWRQARWDRRPDPVTGVIDYSGGL